MAETEDNLNDTKIRELCEGPTYQNEIAGMI